MSLLVVGSVAYDSVRTPAGSRKDALGGSATYFSMSGSYFAEVSVVAVVGEDFRQDDMELLTSHEVDVSGLERRPGSTFRWSGVYGAEDLKNRETLETLLNVFADFAPRLSAEQRRRPYLFLANIAPELQLSVLSQMEARPRLVALDTMDYWIEGSVDSLREVVKKVDILFMDEGEVRSFAGDSNLVKAARRIMDIGPATVVVKRGEHGVLLFRGGEIFAAPAVPLAQVVDPTGAGDSFAGGFMGYLAATGDLSAESYRRAAVVGSVMGSFAVESFSLERLAGLTRQEIDGRFRELTSLAHFLPLDERESLTERVKAQA